MKYTNTDLVKNDKYHRLRSKIAGRLVYFQEQLDYRFAHPEWEDWEMKLRDFERNAKYHLNKLENVGNYFYYEQDKGERNKKEVEVPCTNTQKKNSQKRMMQDTEKLVQNGIKRSDNGNIHKKTISHLNNGMKDYGQHRRQQLVEWMNARENSYRKAYEWAKAWPTREQHIKEELGINIPEYAKEESVLDHLLAGMSNQSYETTKQVLRTRMELEMRNALKEGWFMVMALLTVDLENERKVFEKGSTAWRYWIRDMKERVAREVLIKRYKNEGIEKEPTARELREHKGDFHYVGVVERGEEGTLHIHTVLWMKELPPCSDPNFGKALPNQRKIREYEITWKYGFSSFIAVRWSHNDSYGQLGWQWPRLDNGEPIEASDIDAISIYMGKYITKSITEQQKGSETWRTRTNKMMGKSLMMRTLKTMGDLELKALVKCTTAPTGIEIHGHKVPHRFIRAMAIRESLLRDKYTKRHLGVLPRDTTLKTLAKIGTHRRHGHNLQSFTDSLIKLMNGGAISNRRAKYYGRAKAHIENIFTEYDRYVRPMRAGRNI